jgi:hypothetical protein
LGVDAGVFHSGQQADQALGIGEGTRLVDQPCSVLLKSFGKSKVQKLGERFGAQPSMGKRQRLHPRNME